MPSLFLDANVFLDFYRFGADDIGEMQKLVALIEGEEIALFANDHLVDEIKRNREKVLSETLGDLKGQKYGAKLPNYCSNLTEKSALVECLKQANKLHSTLVSKVDELMKSEALEADKLINKILDTARFSLSKFDVLDAARVRQELRNPPGKKDSLGDAINWESLLQNDQIWLLDVVSKDGDFASDLSPDKIKGFLLAEWVSRKGTSSKVNLFRSLGDYFRARYPQIALSDEQEKNDLISQLEMSPNFSTTHFLIAKLSGYDFFTNQQVSRLFNALVTNTQVGWIATDPDVNEFYKALQPKAWVLSSDRQSRAAEYLEVEEDFFDLF
ncbi:PIN domain-containing protein [Roseobacter litoralis]|uniref:DUF4935 domain-containing protein n=1 Tax=Roseobacter litoralis (strain ATCC 49566 / DSM 6996 / JCM 21268 / NBRC 15278 / OCh 149) TaxID=391595 RepID=F7ZAU2_ROSLO|nr:PIN domain-containing protein [Roseobacter litoralis]AEI95484.1 hypothetical protein RLO149_c035450 [Roseobacter litoralis Och 149]